MSHSTWKIGWNPLWWLLSKGLIFVTTMLGRKASCRAIAGATMLDDMKTDLAHVHAAHLPRKDARRGADLWILGSGAPSYCTFQSNTKSLLNGLARTLDIGAVYEPFRFCAQPAVVDRYAMAKDITITLND